MSFDVGSRWQPHGAVTYRIDEHDTLVGVLPLHCRRGLHLLTDGYTSRPVPEGQNSSGPYVSICCTQCGDDRVADYAWNLTTGDQRPDRIEFDDGPYAEIIAKQQRG